MKKVITILLSTLFMVSMSLGLTACGHEHELTKTSAVSATCETNGNSEYYTCECGKYFSDAEGKNEIAKDSWIISSTGHDHGDEIVYKVIEGKAYSVKTCACGDEDKTEIANAVVVDNTAEAQAAIDGVAENTTIVLNDANYGILYFRKTASSTPVESNWAGGGHSYSGVISGLTILGTEGAIVRKIKAETLDYTPSGNQHSNSATEPYLSFSLTINNLTIKNVKFELEGNDVAVDVLDNDSSVNGLTLVGCSFVDKSNTSTATDGTRVLHSSSQEKVVKNVVIEDCYLKDLHQGIKINALENFKLVNSTFDSIKLHAMLFSGGSTTNLNKSGKIEIKDNEIVGSMGERFIRMTAVNAGAEVVVSGNVVASGITMGQDADIVKITNVSPTASVEVDNTNVWGEKTVTIEKITA
ncbi:MAG: hypothetical protein IJW43_03665 [Clostridia bacterium]|nr:hypothetical protein [Clostridia bacterium]